MPRVRGGDEAERQDEGGNPTVDVRHVFADRGHAPTGTRQAARRAPGWPLRAWRVRVRRNTRTDLTSRPRPETGKELKELSDGLTEIRDSGPAARGATLLALTNTAGSTLAGLCDWSFAAGLSPERVNGGYNATSQLPAAFVIESLAWRLVRLRDATKDGRRDLPRDRRNRRSHAARGTGCRRRRRSRECRA